MSVMGFQKKFGWDVSSIQVFFGFLEFFNFAKPLKQEEESLSAVLLICFCAMAIGFIQHTVRTNYSNGSTDIVTLSYHGGYVIVNE